MISVTSLVSDVSMQLVLLVAEYRTAVHILRCVYDGELSDAAFLREGEEIRVFISAEVEPLMLVEVVGY